MVPGRSGEDGPRRPARAWTVDRYVHEPFKRETERLVEESDPAALERESEALLERIVAEFADVKDWFTTNRTISAIAEGELFARRNLSEGQVAPEIVGKDHEGRSFALGDYPGKVVVLTFSASWCGPCVAMYPQERGLVKKLEGRPFAQVSVNADEDVATLKKSIASGEITWRCLVGRRDGRADHDPMGRRGDPRGLRPRPGRRDPEANVRGDDLEKAVMALLEEKSADIPASK